MRRPTIGGLAALPVILALAGSAHALLPPQYYEQARTDARDVVTITIATVAKPAGPFGECAVSGPVIEVERGTAFQVGQTVTLQVACVVGPETPPPGPRLWAGYEKLTASKRLKAWTNGGAVARDQVELFGRR